jgi:hypothetical protein
MCFDAHSLVDSDSTIKASDKSLEFFFGMSMLMPSSTFIGQFSSILSPYSLCTGYLIWTIFAG